MDNCLFLRGDSFPKTATCQVINIGSQCFILQNIFFVFLSDNIFSQIINRKCKY
jgi:hypothetical protein